MLITKTILFIEVYLKTNMSAFNYLDLWNTLRQEQIIQCKT